MSVWEPVTDVSLQANELVDMRIIAANLRLDYRGGSGNGDEGGLLQYSTFRFTYPLISVIRSAV